MQGESVKKICENLSQTLWGNWRETIGGFLTFFLLEQQTMKEVEGIYLAWSWIDLYLVFSLLINLMTWSTHFDKTTNINEHVTKKSSYVK